MLERIYLCRDWKFIVEEKSSLVNIPHTIEEIPFNYVNEEDYQFLSTYIKTINLSNEYKDKHLILTFEGVGHRSEIYLNNELLLEHFGGYDAFYVDLKDHYIFGKENELKIIVDSKEDPRIPPFGNVVDYLTYGGIYRDVYIDIKDNYHVKDAFVKPYHELNKWGVDIDIELSNIHSYLLEILYKDEVIISRNENLSTYKHCLRIEMYKPHLWDIDNPNLYRLRISINEYEKLIDKYETSFGMRTCVFKVDGFYLNDKKIDLLGLNRHQSFPYIGYAAPESLQRYDAQILKNELHVNIVRTSHYPQSQYFIDECDKIGLLVFTEIPGWQHIGDKSWQEFAVNNTKNMILQYRNHPSIIMWGVRINESYDDHDFYLETNKIAHSLDPTRMTGGVKAFMKGETLEDVYTYNDFIDPNETRGLNKKSTVLKSSDMTKPYMITEYNGHMHPTKMFDNEERRISQFKRIAKGMNEFYGDPEIVGFITWCMFDYNTHKDFGSGDRICYHGVLDMFRNPKIASYLFSSQGNENYMEVSSLMIPGDYDASMIKPMYVFTNADEIKFYKDGMYLRSFDSNDKVYKNIPHAPIKIEDYIGNVLVEKEGYSQKESDMMKSVLLSTLKHGSKLPLKDMFTYLRLMLFHGVTYQKGYELYGKYIGNWGSKETTYTVEGYKDGQLFKTIVLGKCKQGHLDIKVSSTKLVESHTYDMALVRIAVKDQNDNIMPYYQEGFEVSSSGGIDIIGPSILSFKGGYSGLLVKSNGKSSKGVVKINTQIGNKEIKFEIVK